MEAYAYPLLAETMFVFLFIKFNAFDVLTGIEDEDVVNNPLLSVSLSSSENDQVLTKLGTRVAIPCGRWLTHGLTWINL